MSVSSIGFFGRHIDAAMLLALTAATMMFAVVHIDFSVAPYEDAAILMRYADHFAHGHGIVWNIGEKPVDGATDFLFMITLGTLVSAGVSLEFATRFLGFASHVATVWIVFLASRRLFHASLMYASIVSLFLAIGPGLHYVAAYFGTPFFALFASMTWYAALMIIKNDETRTRSFVFACLALITALVRPEGTILSALMLLAMISVRGFRQCRTTVYLYLLISLVLGGLYFFWRWSYFQFPLPNPFYVKGGGVLYWGGLSQSIQNLVSLCFPFLLPFLIGFVSNKTSRLAMSLSIPILGFTFCFVLLSPEMNFAGRFQYVLLPMTLMCGWPLLDGLRETVQFPEWRRLTFLQRTSLTCSAIFICVVIFQYQHRKGLVGDMFRDGRHDISTMLSDYQERHFTLATSEAGLLPLYSHWNAIDLRGLNDQWIAHHGGVTEEYLATYKPHLIVFHDPSSYSQYLTDETVESLRNMVSTARRYAEKNGYLLAASFGDSPYAVHCYYVRPDFPEGSEIVKRIRSTEYSWYETGRKAWNFALFGPK